MRKATITITFDEDKLAAAKLYMEQKELDFDDEMVKAADALYTKFVPTNVREFIDMSAGAKSAAAPPSRRKPKQSTEEAEPKSLSDGVND